MSKVTRGALRITILAAILALGPIVVLRADKRPSADAIANGLTCQCGCGLTVANCNHPQCEFSVPVRTQIEAMIAKGMSGRQILASYRAKYGEKVLSAPTTSGFNLLAWLMPFAAILAGSAVIFLVFSRSSAPPQPAPADRTNVDADLRDLLESEIKHDL